MTTPTIPNGKEYFFPVIYSGNGQAQRVGKFVPFTDNGTIANSCMFNRGDSPNLGKTYSGAGTSQKKFTFSCWVKKSNTDSSWYNLFNVGGNSGSYFNLGFNSGGNHPIQLYDWTGSTYRLRLLTNRTFKDASKWYHIVLAVDTTDSTANDRVKLYVDGQQETSFSLRTNPSLNLDTLVGSADSYNVGSMTSNYLNGYMAEVNYIDGQALGPESFGLTDTSTGRWIPKTVTPYPTTTTDIAVTVVDSGGNKYALDGVTQGTVTLIEGATYKFDQSDSSNSGHPLRFSTTSDGTHGGGSEYTTGVTTVGTPGSSGAYTQITVATGAPTLYYYCSNHSGMGGTANTQNQYGTNGFRLKFQDSSALGDDTSGNGNDLTATNLATTDQRIDSPTNNLPIIRPYNPSYGQGFVSEGGLQIRYSGTNVGYPLPCTLAPDSGKWYAEVRTISNGGGSVITMGIYIQEDMHYWDGSYNFYPGGRMDNGDGCGAGLWVSTGTNYLVSSTLSAQIITSNPTYSLAAGDVFGIAVDRDNDLISFYGNNGSLIGSTSILRPGRIMFTAMAVDSPTSDGWNWNFGDNPTFDGNETAGGNTDSDGNGNFYHSVPSGFKMLMQDNMSTTDKGVSSVVWSKNRDRTKSPTLYDSSRGRHLALFPSGNDAETTYVNGVQKFLAGGQAIGENLHENQSGDSFVSWNWVANGGTTSTNTDGDITSTVQVNTTAGFSIIQYTGNGSANQSIGHGLGVAPRWIIVKELSNTDNWNVWHGTFAGTEKILLDSSGAKITGSTAFGSFTPTSTIFKVNGNNTNASSTTYVAYVWNEIDGFSKFGKYTGNGSTDGTFVYTGFRPAFVLMKRTNSTGNWYLKDTTRDTFNPCEKTLMPNLSNAEAAQTYIDILSNGFKQRIGNDASNLSGSTYIYMAFAEHPFVGDGTSPVTAR